MLIIKNIFKCLLSPRLFNIYRNGNSLYQPGKAEACGDTVIKVATIFRDVSLYISPFIVMYLYWKGITYEELQQFSNMYGAQFSNMFCGLSCILGIAFIFRAWGRACSPEYVLFIEALNAPKTDVSRYLQEIGKYDFEFYAWPATYTASYKPSLWDQKKSNENQHLRLYEKYIVKILAYIAVNTFALRLIYPGSLGIFNILLKTLLLQGRASLIEEYNGKRVKIVAGDGNSIDAMLVDNRIRGKKNIGNQLPIKGNTLVICCEGNSGFYEIGIMMTPLKAGYSVLGWNHPGFAGSTGLPYPRQELAAIDAVLEYATQELKFQQEQIIMYGWSIGGYSAAWAAGIYNTRALVLDATFDDLLALATKQMPASWESLVREVVRGYVDLNVAEVLRNYRGPVHLIRRTDDEIICLTAGDLSTNCGNNLLRKLIESRHSNEDLFDEEQLFRYVNMAEVHRPNAYAHELDAKAWYTLRLISMYSSDIQTSHCVPLPTLKFVTVVRNLLNGDVVAAE